jgi:hypothetical protein
VLTYMVLVGSREIMWNRRLALIEVLMDRGIWKGERVYRIAPKHHLQGFFVYAAAVSAGVGAQLVTPNHLLLGILLGVVAAFTVLLFAFSLDPVTDGIDA